MHRVALLLGLLTSTATCSELLASAAPSVTASAILPVVTSSRESGNAQIYSDSSSPCSQAWKLWIDDARSALSSTGQYIPSTTITTKTAATDRVTRYDLCNVYQRCGSTVRVQVSASPTLAFPPPSEETVLTRIGPSPSSFLKPPPSCSLVGTECENAWAEVAGKPEISVVWDWGVAPAIGPFLKSQGKNLFGCPVPLSLQNKCADPYEGSKNAEPDAAFESSGYCRAILPSSAVKEANPSTTTDKDSSWVYMLQGSESWDDVPQSYSKLETKKGSVSWGRECSVEELEWSSSVNETHRPVLELSKKPSPPFSDWWTCQDAWTIYHFPGSLAVASVIQLPVLPNFDEEADPKDTKGTKENFPPLPVAGQSGDAEALPISSAPPRPSMSIPAPINKEDGPNVFQVGGQVVSVGGAGFHSASHTISLATLSRGGTAYTTTTLSQVLRLGPDGSVIGGSSLGPATASSETGAATARGTIAKTVSGATTATQSPTVKVGKTASPMGQVDRNQSNPSNGKAGSYLLMIAISSVGLLVI